jgi:type 1 glutamine amidotransferase
MPNFHYKETHNMADAVMLAGDRYHKAEEAFTGVGPVLKAAGLDTHTTTDFASIDAEMLKGKKLLVFHRDGMEWPGGHDAPPEQWMKPHQEEAIENFVKNGGSFLVLHNSAWNYPWQGGYRRTVGGYYQFHPPFQKFDVHVVDPNHPITQGITSYEIEDEQHFIWFDSDRVHLLTRSQGKDGRESAAGFCHEYGKGRVAYLGHGHRLSSLQHPSAQKLMTNAVKWLLRA